MSTLLSRLYNFVTDKSNSVKITASRVDGELNQLVASVNRKMLCAATAPADPINGQTWVDTTANLVKCYLNNDWVIIANYIYIQTAEPEGMAEGYLWYDTANNLLKSYNGSTWDIIGDVSYPASTAQGDLLYVSAAKTLSRLAKSATANQVIVNSGADNNPVWAGLPIVSSYAADGYVKIGTLVIQWGRFTSNNAENTTITFPLAFPNACYSVQATKIGADSNPNIFFVHSISTTQAQFHNYTGDTCDCMWLAIGY